MTSGVGRAKDAEMVPVPVKFGKKYRTRRSRDNILQARSYFIVGSLLFSRLGGSVRLCARLKEAWGCFEFK
jgi:hypothetical protein